jgi:hypothetical protein
LAFDVYNNLSDGDWGKCCTTSTQLFVEMAMPDNLNVYNNVAIQHPNNYAPAWDYGSTNGIFANNTAIGVASTPQNTTPINLSGTGITFENNTIQGYGTYVVVAAGTTFIKFDYNQYGPIGISGNPAWGFGSNKTSSFSVWQSVCSCDAHGGRPSSLGVSSTGIPQAGSALIGAGTNLTNLGIHALDYDTSAGGTRAPANRPTSGAWDVGAYRYPVAPLPSAPTHLTGSVH